MDTDSIKSNIKRFFSNPNTLTFLFVIALIIVIYLIYNFMVSRAISPVNIPYANQLLTANTKITKDVVGNVKISGSFATSSGEGLIQNQRLAIDKYVAKGYQIPKNSFFYKEALASETESNTTAFTNIPDGYTIFRLDVDFHKTYGNSMMPNNYIDLYFKAKDDDGSLIYGLFIKSIKIYKVVDKDGVDVFSYSDASGEKEPEPKYLYFEVPDSEHDLLRKAQLIKSNGIEIIPVPRNNEYSENPEPTSIASEAIKEFILSRTQDYGDN